MSEMSLAVVGQAGTTRRDTRRSLLLAETLVGLVAVAARLPGVWGQPFWEDEVASARILREPTIPLMLHRIGQTESTPPLWYLIAWLGHHAGAPLQDERLLSVVFGGLLSAAAVRLAVRFVPLRLAVFVGLLTAVGGEFVWHGHELRAYELLALLAASFGLCLLAELEAPSRWREFRLAAVVVAGGSTHYFFGFGVAAALIWLWLDPGARRIRRRASAALVLGAAVALCWAPLALTQSRGNRFWWIGHFQFRTVLAVPLRLFTGAYSGQAIGLTLSLTTFAVLVIGSARLGRRSAAGRLVGALAVGPILLSAAVWAAGPPIFDFRNLIGVGPFVAVGLAAAIEGLPGRTPLGLLATLSAAAILVALALTGEHRIPAYDAIAKSLVHSGWTGTQPIAVYGDPSLYRTPLEWYLPDHPVLDIARPLPHACTTVYVIERSGTVRVVHQQRPPTSHLKRVRLLVQRGKHPQCSALIAPRHPPAVAQSRPRVGTASVTTNGVRRA